MLLREKPRSSLRLGDQLALESYTRHLPSILRSETESRFSDMYLSRQLEAKNAAQWLENQTNAETRPAIRLCKIHEKLKDFSSKNKLFEIIKNERENPERIQKIPEFLDDKTFKNVTYFQALNEKQICNIAQSYSTRENPSGHLKARRWLRTQAKQATAKFNLILGSVGKDGFKYATPFEIELRNQQKARWLAFGEKTELTIDDKKISMSEIMKSSSHKKLSEVYCLSKGLEKYAKAAGATWCFITLTCPPSMHPNPKIGVNNWDGTTPDLAHRWLHKNFRRALARLRKNDVIPAGVRVAEPHGDGCPHWHVLFFCHPSELAIIEKEFRKQNEWKTEAGMKFVINNGKASAASYLFKYVLKTVSQIEKLEGDNAGVDAWRSTWGIRAFQWIGMPPVGLWRRFRQLKDCPENQKLSGIWRAAKRGDSATFIALSGGLGIKAKHRPIISMTEVTETTKTNVFILRETGEAEFFESRKWMQTQKAERNKDEKVTVILSYPRGPKPTPKPAPFFVWGTPKFGGVGWRDYPPPTANDRFWSICA